MARLDPTGVSRILSYIKNWVTTALSGKANSSHSHSDYIPKSGGSIMTGNRISRVDNTYELCMDGGRSYGDGATLTLFGKNTPNSGNEGTFWLTAYNTAESTLIGKPDGSLTWNGVAISLSNHTHTKSQITDFPTIPSNTSQLTNDSGYITSSGSCNYANSTGYVQGNNNSANAANALLRSGGGRSDSSPEGDTWIFLDELGGSSAPWGFKHNQGANTIGFYGAGTETSSINLSNGYFSGSCNYANSAGGVAWDNVSGKPSAFTPYFANGTWYAVGDDAAIGDHNVGGGLGVKALNSTTTRIDFCYKDDASNYKSITYDGTTLYMNGNCDYATNSGSSTYSTYLNSLGAQTPKSGRDIFHPGVYTYTTYTDTNTPAHYGAVIGYGNGHGGSCEMFAEWVGSGQLWFRVLRDWQDSWTSWEKINTESNTVLNGYRIYVG